MSRKGNPAIVSWSGDWRCACGSQNKLWDQCVCGQPSPCREWVRGNCSMPKCRFPHPPFKIPEHLPKPADPIANPPAAAAKQKAVAQAHAAAMAAERNPLCKEMAIVTWLGHWQCNCGKVHKLWDACKCGQQPPCREWVRGQCDLPKCRFPHPPFAIPSNLPKPDDPIANPTPEQLAIPLQSSGEAAGAERQQKAAAPAPLATANGKVESGGSAAAGSGGSTPLAGGEGGGLPNPSVFGAVGQPVPAGGANGHKVEPTVPPPPPPSTTKPGVSFRAALLKSAAAAAAGGEHAAQAAAEADGPHAEHAPAPAAAEAEQQQAAVQAQQEHKGFQAQQQSSEGEHHIPQLAAAARSQHMLPQQAQQAAAEEQAQQQAAQQAGTQEEQQQAHEGLAQQQQNGSLDPVVAAPASARCNAAAAAATAGLGWNPMAQGVFSPIGPLGAQPESPSAAAAAGGQLPATAAQQAGQQAQPGGAMQLPPAPAPVATHAPSTLPSGQQASLPAAGPSPRVPGPGMLQPQQQQQGPAHLGPSAMSPRLGGMHQAQQAQQGMVGAVGSAMSPRSFMSQQAAGMGGVGAAAMSPRFLGAGGSAARPPLGLQMSGGAGAGGPGGAGTCGLKPAHLAALHSNGMGGLGVQPGLGSGAPGQQHAAAAAQQQQYTLHAALQQMALQQQQQQLSAQQQKPVAVIAKTLLEYGLMDPAFYHALRQVDFLPDGYYQQDTLTLEDQQRRMELFNAAVDSYIAAGVDNRSMLEISCQAKIGLTGGPLYYRCANCGQPIPTEMRQRWCAVCKVTPFCSPECHHRLYQQHRGVCNSMLTKPLLPSQIALRIAVEIYNVHGLTGAALHQAILRQTAAVQRSYAAAAAAAAAAGVVDE